MSFKVKRLNCKLLFLATLYVPCSSSSSSDNTLSSHASLACSGWGGGSEIITGERLQAIADISVVTASWLAYHRSLPDVIKEEHAIILIDEEGNIVSGNRTRLVLAGTVFVYSHLLPRFFLGEAFSAIYAPFVLLSHNGDEELDLREGRGEEEWKKRARSALSSGRIIGWWAQNLVCPHPAVNWLPIGLANSMWRHGDLTTMSEVMRSSQDASSKNEWLHVAFKVSEHAPGRQQVFEILSQLDFATVEGEKLPFREYLLKTSSHRFCASPRGNGIDTHRMWECLYLHTIPIVEDSLFARQFAGMIVHETEGGETFCSYTVEVLGPSLPVLLVSDWSSVQLCVLERAWELALSMEWDWEVLTMSRWKNFIRSHTREGQ